MTEPPCTDPAFFRDAKLRVLYLLAVREAQGRLMPDTSRSKFTLADALLVAEITAGYLAITARHVVEEDDIDLDRVLDEALVAWGQEGVAVEEGDDLCKLVVALATELMMKVGEDEGHASSAPPSSG